MDAQKKEPFLALFIPIKTVSEGNSREHWRKSHARHVKQKNAVALALRNVPLILPVEVRLIRHGVRLLDSDNLQFSFKWIRDSVADCLIPGLAKGRADDDPRITWDYAQVKVKRGEEGFTVAFA